MQLLWDLISASEDWLLKRVVDYAREREYTKYTSTLEEAWRVSVAGVSSSLLEALQRGVETMELEPDEDYTRDPVARFGIEQARRHRRRGVTLAMFLGCMKYYRRAYVDLVREAGFDRSVEERYRRYINCFFDRVEIGFCTEWSSVPGAGRLDELQQAGRVLTNEKNKYLTVFESLPNPVLLLDRTGGKHEPGGSPFISAAGKARKVILRRR